MQVDTFIVNMTWHAFGEILEKHPDRVQDDINAGLVSFTDRSVTVHVPYRAIGRTPETPIH